MSRTSFLLVEILTFLVFIGLGFTVGSNIWDNNVTQVETSFPKTLPEPLLSLPDGERILLLAGVDNFNTSQPQLESLWLLTYYLEDAPIQFLPIYPSGINPPTELERTLINTFSLENDNGKTSLNPEFLGILSDSNYWVSGYLVFDSYAYAQAINLIGGLPTHQGSLSGEQILDSIPLAAEDPHAAHVQQILSLGQACQTISRMPSHPNWQSMVHLFADKHIFTNLNPNGLLVELQQLTVEPSRVRCEFPSWSAVP